MRLAQLALISALLLSACSGITPTGAAPVSVVVESPQSNTRVALGEPVLIRAGVGGDGVATLQVNVDGVQLARTVLSGDVRVANEQWLSDSVGQHIITVDALDAQGAVIARSEPAFVLVVAPTATPAPPTPTPQVLPTATAAAVVEATATPVATTSPATVTVNVLSANLRAAPGLTGTINGQVGQGTVLTTSGRSPDGAWWRVISGTVPLFISADLVTAGPAALALGAPAPVLAPTATAAAVVTATGQATATTSAPSVRATVAELAINVAQANLRGGPGVNYVLLGVATQGTVLPVTGRNADSTWWQATGATTTVWVFGELVVVSAAARNAPVVAAPPLPTALPAPTAAPAIVTIAAPQPTAVPALVVAAAPAADAGLPPCNPDNPWWGVKVHKDDGYTFCVPVQFEFVGPTDGDEIRMKWHIYGIEKLEMRVDPDPNGCDGGPGTTPFRAFVDFKTDDFRLNRRSFRPGGYKVGLWAILPGGREQDWGQLNFCGKG
jgi:uncharacterized protein YraI